MPTNFFFDESATQPEVLAAVRTAVEVFEKLGAKVQAVEYPDLDRYSDDGAFLADAAAYHEGDLLGRVEDYAPIIRGRLQTALETRATDYSRARYRQFEMKRAYGRLFRDIDLLLTPTSPIVAPRIDGDPVSRRRRWYATRGRSTRWGRR